MMADGIGRILIGPRAFQKPRGLCPAFFDPAAIQHGWLCDPPKRLGRSSPFLRSVAARPPPLFPLFREVFTTRKSGRTLKTKGLIRIVKGQAMQTHPPEPGRRVGWKSCRSSDVVSCRGEPKRQLQKFSLRWSRRGPFCDVFFFLLLLLLHLKPTVISMV